MRDITDVLKDLGVRARLEIEHDGQAYFDALYPPAKAGSPSHPDVFMSGWQSDYPGANNFLDPQFACGARGFGNPFGWCDPELDRAMDDALALLPTDPAAANRAWTDIEHGLIEDAAMVPLTNPVTTHAVSERVGNVQVNPQWGILLSRLWVQ
jgi:ABC-type transport system substrate-binding protein